jgi:carbonic anhydrase
VFKTTDTYEKPQNGLAGLKHWRFDVMSGLMVSLVSLPLSMGIAIASGAEPITGLTSAIVAGLVFPLFSGGYVTISGPAAGSAPVLLGIMMALGGGSSPEQLSVGLPLLLVVVFLAGIAQILLSILRLARFAAVIPSSVVEGMLASIGMLIIVKQLPSFLGVPFHAHEFLEYVAETPAAFTHAEPRVFTLSLLCFVLLMTLGSLKVGWVKKVSPQLVTVAFGIVLGQVLNLSDGLLIRLPDNPWQGVRAPAFAELFSRSDLWWAAGLGVVSLVLVEAVESLATAMAIDKIDPFHRRTDPNRVLLGIGVCDICSSLVGGLSVIPGGVKSKVNVANGGRTLWANFYNAVFLILFLLVGPALINLIPRGTLAAVLVYTGWRMCEPAIWRAVKSIGIEQLWVFSVTVVATLLTDLLIGIIVGTMFKVLMALFFVRQVEIQRGQFGQAASGFWHSFRSLFVTPLREVIEHDDGTTIHVDGPVICTNAIWLQQALDRTMKRTGPIRVNLGSNVTLIDHTACEGLLHFIDEARAEGRQADLIGMDRLRKRSTVESSLRVAELQETGLQLAQSR